MSKKYKDVDIREIPLEGGNKITILVGGFSSPNPKEFMDGVVSRYVGDSPYNEFIESHLDMPQIRIILSGINEICYSTYNEEKHHL